MKTGDINITGKTRIVNAFQFTLDANASTDAVTFPKALYGGGTIVVVCTPPYQTSFWITNVTATGFTFNVGTTSGYAQLINCIVMERYT
jgi:hypothetical protein